ncbi:hypothetical protein HU200_023077 [Digitaria exilis]|uniref:Calpain catalytic domain-containing protein n=1 Tax=Digitaria exilis TaxID=1010633 RepID=A0A835EYE9_9POAL|nr:hypothetical protein HU200_023077 [Digitaria exilis]
MAKLKGLLLIFCSWQLVYFVPTNFVLFMLQLVLVHLSLILHQGSSWGVCNFIGPSICSLYVKYCFNDPSELYMTKSRRCAGLIVNIAKWWFELLKSRMILLFVAGTSRLFLYALECITDRHGDPLLHLFVSSSGLESHGCESSGSATASETATVAIHRPQTIKVINATHEQFEFGFSILLLSPVVCSIMAFIWSLRAEEMTMTSKPRKYGFIAVAAEYMCWPVSLFLKSSFLLCSKSSVILGLSLTVPLMVACLSFAIPIWMRNGYCFWIPGREFDSRENVSQAPGKKEVCSGSLCYQHRCFTASIIGLGAIVSAKPLDALGYKGWDANKNSFYSPYASSMYLGWALSSTIAVLTTGLIPIVAWFATYRFSPSSAICVGLFATVLVSFCGASYWGVVNSREDGVPLKADFLAALLPLLCIPAFSHCSPGCTNAVIVTIRPWTVLLSPPIVVYSPRVLPVYVYDAHADSAKNVSYAFLILYGIALATEVWGVVASIIMNPPFVGAGVSATTLAMSRSANKYLCVQTRNAISGTYSAPQRSASSAALLVGDPALTLDRAGNFVLPRADVMKLRDRLRNEEIAAGSFFCGLHKEKEMEEEALMQRREEEGKGRERRRALLEREERKWKELEISLLSSIPNTGSRDAAAMSAAVRAVGVCLFGSEFQKKVCWEILVAGSEQGMEAGQVGLRLVTKGERMTTVAKEWNIGASSIADGRWHLVTVTIDADLGEATSFIDGNYDGYQNGLPLPTNNDAFGRSDSEGSDSKMQIMDAFLWGRCLSEDEVAALHSAMSPAEHGFFDPAVGDAWHGSYSARVDDWESEDAYDLYDQGDVEWDGQYSSGRKRTAHDAVAIDIDSFARRPRKPRFETRDEVNQRMLSVERAVRDALIAKGERNFTDQEFPPDDRSLFVDPMDPPVKLQVVSEWMRPSDIAKEISINSQPCLFSGSVNSSDVCQGRLGDCWFLSAVAVLTEASCISEVIITPEYNEEGIYTVRFCIQGEWVAVVVDDWIPCESPGKPAFATSRKQNELWVSILEKAYAKLHGSYEALEGGLVQDALVDLTGGAGEEIDMRSPQAQIDLASGRLWSQLLYFKQEGFLLGAGSPSGSDVHISSSGIVQGHAYSILQVREVDGHKLIQIRNPWANEVEWNGPWSDSSPEWTERMKHKLMHVPQGVGFSRKTNGFRNYQSSHDSSMFYIGLRILKTQGCRAAYNIYMHESAGGTDYVNSREISCELVLDPYPKGYTMCQVPSILGRKHLLFCQFFQKHQSS